MKARLNRLGFVFRLAVAASVLAAAPAWVPFARPAAAAVYTYDNGTMNPSGPTDGSGPWSVPGNWWNGTGYQTWNNATNDTAQFGYLSGNSNQYTVTLDATGDTAGAVVFQDQAYTLSGSTLTMAGVSPTITTNAANGAISAGLPAAAGLTTAGTGMLTLSNVNTYTGAIRSAPARL